MEPGEGSLVDRAIRDALRDGLDAYEQQGVLVLPHLESRTPLSTDEPTLYQAIYTIFRGLPERLAPGATLFIRTRDRAGGDIELVWEAREVPHAREPSPTPAVALGHGPYGDLLELAIIGLESLCRARGGVVEEPEDEVGESVTFLRLAPRVRRRYFFLIPALRRGGWPAERRATSR